MFCSNCGKELTDNVVKCPYCGTATESDINLSAIADYAGKQVNKAATEVQVKTQAGFEAFKKEQKALRTSNLADIIVDSEEEQIAVIGSNYLDNMLRGNGLSKGFGILTDKRFYFRGKCFTKVAGYHKLVDEEYSIDLEDITATGFVFSRRILLLLLALVVGLCISFVVPLIVGIIVGLLLLVLYWFTKKAVYEVYFKGGVLCINVSKYGGINEVKAFNKKLRQTKDKRK